MAIYYLDVDDEITSAAARIRDSSDNRIALVLSGGSRVATSRINFRLLAREARHRSKRLAIIAADPSVQSIARSADLPVYASVADYEKAEAAMARVASGRPAAVTAALDELALSVKPGAGGGAGRTGVTRVAGGPATSRAPGLGISRPILAGFAALLILVIAAAGFFFYPSASVVLTLRGEPVGPMTISVKVDPSALAANDQATTVPGLSKAFPVDASGTFNATGQNVVDTAATGTVTFTSKNTVSSLPVVAGTQVSTVDGIAFVTTKSVTIPPANFDTHVAGSADAPVQAVKKGIAGNVAARKIVRLPADLASLLVSVSNASGTTGGTHTVTPEIQQSDLDAAEATLLAQLDSSFQDAMNASGAVPAGSTLFADSAKLGLAVCNPDPQILLTQTVASFQLDCQGTGTVTVAEMANVRDLALRRIRGAVKSGYSLVTGSESATLGAPIVQGGSVAVPVVVQAMQVRTVNVDQLRAAIEGKSLEEARTFLSAYGQADIAVSPSWSSTMPSFDFRIDVQLVGPSAGPSSGASPSAGPIASTGPTARPPARSIATPIVSPASPPPTPLASLTDLGIPSPSVSPSTSPPQAPSASPSPS